MTCQYEIAAILVLYAILMFKYEFWYRRMYSLNKFKLTFNLLYRSNQLFVFHKMLVLAKNYQQD